MCTQDGPSLPVACDLRRSPELQGIPLISDIPKLLLLDLLLRIGIVGMAGDS